MVEEPDWRAVGAPPYYFIHIPHDLALLSKPYLGRHNAPLMIHTHENTEHGVEQHPGGEPIPSRGFGAREVHRAEYQGDHREEKARFLVGDAAEEGGA